jgi:hypothetical protein
VRLSWYQDAAGEWAYQGVDAHLWYRSKHQAKHAAGKHYRSFGP